MLFRRISYCRITWHLVMCRQNVTCVVVQRSCVAGGLQAWAGIGRHGQAWAGIGSQRPAWIGESYVLDKYKYSSSVLVGNASCFRQIRHLPPDPYIFSMSYDRCSFSFEYVQTFNCIYRKLYRQIY